MKYTIELTENQKKQMDFMLDMANKHMGFKRKLEMIETTNVEDTDEYQIGYKVGRKDGFAYCRYNTELTEELKQAEYNKGLEDGYKGYKYLHNWFANTCFFDVEDILFPEYKRRQADTCCLEDIITDVGITEVLKRVRAYEEKKKAGEIKVGDEVETEGGYKCVVAYIYDEKKVSVMFSDGSTGKREIEHLSKTGRNFGNEVEQLLDKLRGKK